MRRGLSLCLAFLLIAIISTQALAETPETASGSCGKAANWFLSGDTLIIRGEGIVDSTYPSPWDEYKNQIVKVVVEEGITEISDCVFMNLIELEEVHFPKSLTHLGGQVFQGCDKIEAISIPENVEVIGNPGTYRTAATTFSCASLTRVDVASGNRYFYSVDGVLFDGVNNTLLCYPQAKSDDCYVVPDGIREIAAGAFWFSAINRVDLPKTLEVIGDGAFTGTLLSTITIPDDVCEIPQNAFSNCDNLKDITIPQSVQSIGRCAFASCDALKEIIFLGTDCLVSNVADTIPKRTVLRGYINSDIHTYARTYGHKFADTETGKVYNYDAGNEGLLALLPTNITASCPVFNRIRDGGNTIGGYQPTLVLETEMDNETYQEMLAFVEDVTADHETDYEKAYYLLCWVNDNMSYEYANFGIGETAEGVYQLWDGRRSNCEGYTQLYNFLLYLAGIPNATATSVDHCCTVALLDGEWRMIDATNRLIDKAPNDYDDVDNIFFGIDNTLVCVVDDMTGVKLASYGLNVRDTHTCREITIPDYITFIYGSAFRYRDYDTEDPKVTIHGTVGSCAQEYVENNLPGYIISYEGKHFVASSMKEAETPEHVHNLQVVPYQAATHELVGNVEYYTCIGCGMIFADSSMETEIVKDQTVIPAEGHQYGEYLSDLERHWMACSCGKTNSIEEHNWSEWIIVTVPTPVETGVEVHKCLVCGYEEQRELPCTQPDSEDEEENVLSTATTEKCTQSTISPEETKVATTFAEETTIVETLPTNGIQSQIGSNTDGTSSETDSPMWILVGGAFVGAGCMGAAFARGKRRKR